LPKLLRPTFVNINLDHLKKNLNFFSQSPLGKIFICPMVKANAYGHGDLNIVKSLESMGCKRFGVGLVEEGIHLREAGRALSEILVFGFTGKAAITELLRYKLTPVVSDWEQLETLSDLSRETVNIHIKLDTGMHRLGFPAEDLEKVFEIAKTTKNLRVVGICTHLATAENLGDIDASSYSQLTLFKSSLEKINHRGLLFHAYNTEGALRAIESKELQQKFPYGLRPGLGLYGLADPTSPLSQKLLPVMSLKSKVVSVQKVKKGQSVSYGGTWKAPKDSVVGIVPVGYADGIPTQLSNRGFVLLEEQRLPIVGRVCMDYTLIDVSAVTTPLMKPVEFFGENISVHEVAELVGTISYDILTGISERVPRIFSEGSV
jgi:alanine racemase